MDLWEAWEEAGVMDGDCMISRTKAFRNISISMNIVLFDKF